MAASDYMPTEYPDFSDPSKVLDWRGRDKWNAIYTITLGELIDHDIFNWDMSLINWRDAAYSEEQYKRVCDYFIERFRFREISIVPFFDWGALLHRKLVYELMPKYRVLYKMLDDDFDIAQVSDKYHKGRTVGSEYPETLLSGNSDYASTGTDEEHEDIERGAVLDAYLKYQNEFQAIDKQLLDELEDMFIGLYTVSLDGM